MKKLLRFLFSIGTTFSLVSCGLLDGLNETEEDDSTGGFDFGGDSSFQEDTTPSDNNPSSDDPSPNPGTETTKTVYRINFYNCGTHLGYLDLEEGTKVDKNTYTKIPSYPTTSNQYQYTFVGWTETRASNDIGSASTYTVNKNVNLHALYSRDLKKYSVTFYYGTTKLGSQDFDYGSVIGTNNAYGYSEKLIKSATGTTYTFIGWNKERPDNDVGTASTYTITADLTLFAVFTSATNSYSVTFINEGATLGSQSFPFGSKIEKGNMYGYNLSKSSTSQYTYSFDGWHETSTSSSGATYLVTKNMTVHAIYTSAVRQYTVTFKNNGNNVGNPITYTYGQKPSCSITPSKQGSGVTYTFVGWSENPNATATSSNVFPNDNLPTVSKNTTYHAIFSSTTITYQITFKNGNTTLKGPTAVNYNTKPSAPTNNPTKDEEKNDSTGIKYTYAFAGWSTNSNASAGANNVYASNNLPVATKDDTYYAIFSKTTYYLVTFYNDTTPLTSDYYVESGKKPTYSGTPSKQGSGVTYTFIGWNETSTATSGTLTANLPVVSKKTTYYAIFSSTSTGGGSGGSGSEPVQLEGEKIELAYPSSQNALSHLSDEYTLFLDKDIEYDEISYELESTDDTDFFQITKNNDSLVIKTIKQNRFTYLTIVYKKNSTIVRIKKHILLSVMRNFARGFYNRGKLGETSFENNKYAYCHLNSGLNNSQQDLVLPSRLTLDGEAREVIEIRSSYTDINVRRIYIPNTVCFFLDGALPCVCCTDNIKFEKSKWGFLLFCKKSLIASQGTRGLFTESGDYLSCFIKGENYYDFPYKKVGISANLTWNSGELSISSWDWQTNFINYYKNGVSDQNSESWQTYLSLKQSFADNNYYFCN